MFKKTTLANGLRIITIPIEDNPTVTVLVMVEAGSKYEDKNTSGLSHFLEHMCFKGTVKRPKAIDISRELDSIGSQYNAFTSQEFTGYYAKSDYKHFDTVLNVVSDIYLNPVFPEVEIEREKGVIVEEINMYQDLPQRHVQELFMKLLYGDSPAGWNIAGHKETVRAMKKNNFIDYRTKHYVAASTLVIVAGRFDEGEAIQKIEQSFKDVNLGEKQKKIAVQDDQQSPNIYIQKKNTDQTHLVLGVRSYDIMHKNNPTLRVLETVLGGGMSSRLFQRLREEMGVGYYVRGENVSFTDHGFFEVSTGVDKTRVQEVIEAVLEELGRLKNEKVLPEELKKAKDYIAGTLYLGLESSDSIAEYYGFQELLRREILSPEETLAKIQAVTADDIMRIAEEMFVDSKLNLALIGDVEDPKSLEKILTFK